MKKPPITCIQPGTAEEVVGFAKAQIFGPVETIQPRPTDAPARNLQQVICELHQSEINAGLQTFWDCGFRVWIGDELNGRAAEAEMGPRDAAWGDDAAIAHWLHETAIRLYPDSDYERRDR